MTIASFSGLASAVPVWMGRDGDAIVPAQINDIVTLAETGIIYGLDEPFQAPPVRLRFMETVNPAFAISSEYTALPAGFLEARELVLGTSPKATLLMRSPQDIDEMWAGSQTGQSEVFAIQGNQLRVAPAPSGSFTAAFTYWSLARLDNTVPSSTNNLLTNAPNVYLHAACMYGFLMLGDLDAAKAQFALYRAAVGGVQKSDDAGKWSGAAPAMRVMGPTP
jgi:hypothetical protein